MWGFIEIVEVGGEVFDVVGELLDFFRGRWFDLDIGIIVINKELKFVVLLVV